MLPLDRAETPAAGVCADAAGAAAEKPLNALTSYAHNTYYAQHAGEAAAHVTEGTAHEAPPAAFWGEIPDAAGQSSAIAARRRAAGSCHFFGQAVWPNREGLGPFHGPLTLSERGRQHWTARE